MNAVSLLGRLTKDSDLVSTNEYKICRFTLAVPRAITKDGKRESDFIECVAYGKTGELINQYVHKGDQLAVNGRIRTSSYEKEGKKYYSTNVVVDNMEFISTKKGDSKETTSESTKGTASQNTSIKADDIEIPDEMLPF